jgi:hypothetical protein
MLFGVQVIIPLYVSDKQSITDITMVGFQIILYRPLNYRQWLNASRHPTF